MYAHSSASEIPGMQIIASGIRARTELFNRGLQPHRPPPHLHPPPPQLNHPQHSPLHSPHPHSACLVGGMKTRNENLQANCQFAAKIWLGLTAFSLRSAIENAIGGGGGMRLVVVLTWRTWLREIENANEGDWWKHACSVIKMKLHLAE